MKFLVLSFLNLFDFFYKKKLLAKLKEFVGLDIDIFFDVGAHKGETINLILKTAKLEIKKISNIKKY